ncbi:MBL fold metallo-hydrolase [Jannaschia sp. Os4]|uniref:MBL fold metallo-hydrolase n=1 Tax=Jannaschia sp. Os4 TaxID=2807617 RepID=UPI00193A9800|nr:MBL fold metallo-hydrolase [Jannaschia sp. Os4]MBM2575386.1 MBL fold metallo-hydrolase [Jannaschia sp. Os4]
MPLSRTRRPGIPAAAPTSDRPTRRRVCTLLAAAASAPVLAPRAARAAHGSRAFDVGALTARTVSDGWLDLPRAAFPNLDEHAAPGADPVRVGAFGWAIDRPQGTLLIDAGAGDSLRDAFPETGRAPGHLRAAGIGAGSVTDVILTHLHADHAGGLLTATGAPRYPNATVHVAAAELAHWTDDATLAAATGPVLRSARLARRLVAALGDRLAPHGGMADLGGGVHVLPAPGHTPGHGIVHLSDGGAEAMLIADAFICGPMQMAHPRITYALDHDPAQAVETRMRLLDRLATDGIAFSATHLTTPVLGYADRYGTGGYAFALARR